MNLNQLEAKLANSAGDTPVEYTTSQTTDVLSSCETSLSSLQYYPKSSVNACSSSASSVSSLPPFPIKSNVDVALVFIEDGGACTVIVRAKEISTHARTHARTCRALLPFLARSTPFDPVFDCFDSEV